MYLCKYEAASDRYLPKKVWLPTPEHIYRLLESCNTRFEYSKEVGLPSVENKCTAISQYALS